MSRIGASFLTACIVLSELLAFSQESRFEILRRSGAAALPQLVELLGSPEASIRREAVSVMIDLAPDTEAAQPALVRALNDEDAQVARDAARALGALGERAGSSVPQLVKALSHWDSVMRTYVAEALASIGPAAAAATPELTKALRDVDPRARWAAAEALAAIGPNAAPAVPVLIEALKDEFLYVRICAAGALGSIGLKTEPVIAGLRAAANDPAMRAEAEWALHQLTGVAPAPAAAVFSGELRRGTAESVGAKAILPDDWDIKTGRNIAWSVALGSQTFGRPVVSGGVVYVGTDNGGKRDQICGRDCGVLQAFRASDGELLWQDAAPRVDRGMGDFLLASTTGGPHVEGDRLYYVTAECQLRCLDTRPRDEPAARKIWELDMPGRLGVFPHEASNSDVLAIGDLLIVATSNGQNEGHTRVPSPRAPSLIAVDKRSGDVVWRAIGPGANVLHGQWSSPALADVGGRPQVLFGGGDGWLRAYDASSGRELWRFDGNPPESKYLPRPRVFSRGSIIATPVLRRRPRLHRHGDGSDARQRAVRHVCDQSEWPGGRDGSRVLWSYRGIGRVVGTPVLKDGLLYVADLGGVVHCLDAATGAVVWTHETDAPIWGCLIAAGDRLYVGNTDGVLTVLSTGRRKKELARVDMEAPLYSRPALAGDALYLATARRLYVVKAEDRKQQYSR